MPWPNARALPATASASVPAASKVFVIDFAMGSLLFFLLLVAQAAFASSSSPPSSLSPPSPESEPSSEPSSRGTAPRPARSGREARASASPAFLAESSDAGAGDCAALATAARGTGPTRVMVTASASAPAARTLSVRGFVMGSSLSRSSPHAPSRRRLPYLTHEAAIWLTALGAVPGHGAHGDENGARHAGSSREFVAALETHRRQARSARPGGSRSAPAMRVARAPRVGFRVPLRPAVRQAQRSGAFRSAVRGRLHSGWNDDHEAHLLPELHRFLLGRDQEVQAE